MKRYIKSDTDYDYVFSPHPDTRHRLATYITDPEVLEIYAYDPSVYVREGVAYNRHTPPELLRHLASDVNDSVREQVAGNPNTPLDVLVQLANEPNNWIKRSVATNRNAPTELLVQLADGPFTVREMVAANPNTPVGTLSKLLEDNDPDVQYMAEQNMRQRGLT